MYLRTVSFVYVPFTIRYAGIAWISLESGGNDWEVRVRVDLTTRADTGRINTSPTSAISPIVRLQYGCSHTIVIPGTVVLQS